MKNKIICLLLLLLSLTSCREEMPGIQNPSTEVILNWDRLFESYWNGLNYNYVFWDIDPTDWNKVYDTYKPKFEQIASKGFEDEATNEQAFKWIKELSSSLIDHHLAVIINLYHKNGEIYVFQPGKEEVSQRDGYHENMVFTLRPNNFHQLKEAGRFKGDIISFGPDEETGIDSRYYISGLLDDEIAYLGFSNFAFTSDLQNNNASSLQALLDTYYNILDNYPHLKGVIIDVRGNGGGFLNDLKIVLGKFISEPLEVFQIKGKNGTGRLDYTPFIPQYLQPVTCKRKLDIPVVALADMHSISMAEMCTMSVLALPAKNGVFIGEQTYGGTGTISFNFDANYSGQFENDMLYVYTCSTSLVDVNGVSYEGKGISPTLKVPLDSETYQNTGADNQLERAIEYIKKGK